MDAHGEYLYGKVDHAPGLFYVSTMFFQFSYLPLLPLRSYVIFEGSEHGEQFHGVQIPLSTKSVVAGYLRGWLGAAAMFTGCIAAAATTGYYAGKAPGRTVLILASVAAMAAVMWFILKARSRWFLPLQLALLLASAAAYHDVKRSAPDAKRGSAERRRHDASYIDMAVIANAAALSFSLVRLFTPASYRRALELGALAGIPPEQIAASFGRADGGQAPDEWPPREA